MGSPERIRDFPISAKASTGCVLETEAGSDMLGWMGRVHVREKSIRFLGCGFGVIFGWCGGRQGQFESGS